MVAARQHQGRAQRQRRTGEVGQTTKPKGRPAPRLQEPPLERLAEPGESRNPGLHRGGGGTREERWADWLGPRCVHGLAVLDVDTGDPTDLERRYPPLATADTRRGTHLFYSAPDKPLGNSNWEAKGCSGEVRCSNGYVVVWDPMALWSALQVMAEDKARKHPFPMQVLTEHGSTPQTALDDGGTHPPDGAPDPQSNTSNHQVRRTIRDTDRTLATWSQDDVAAAYGDGLQKVGRELKGPCPLCKGIDRFRVMASGKFFCRRCLPDGKDKDRFRQMANAMGLPLGSSRRQMLSPDWEGEKRRATIDRQIAETARERGTVGPNEDADGMIAEAADRENKAS